MKDAINIYNPNSTQSDDEKTYLVLFNGTDEDGEQYKTYEYIVGSDNVIIAIMDQIDILDLFKSEIILQDKDITLFQRKTLLDFINYKINKSKNNPLGNDLVRLGYGDFDLHNYIENSLLMKDIEYQTESEYNKSVNMSSNEKELEDAITLYENVEGGDV